MATIQTTTTRPTRLLTCANVWTAVCRSRHRWQPCWGCSLSSPTGARGERGMSSAGMPCSASALKPGISKRRSLTVSRISAWRVTAIGAPAVSAALPADAEPLASVLSIAWPSPLSNFNVVNLQLDYNSTVL